MKMHHVSMELIKEVIDFISVQIHSHDVKYDYVIGVARGGMIPATMMAYKLDIPLLCYSLSSYDDTNQTSISTHQEINFDILDDNLNILVIDDICDSGETFKYIRDILKPKVNTETHVAIFSKKKNINVPDIVGLVTCENEWIVFPWE